MPDPATTQVTPAPPIVVPTRSDDVADIANDVPVAVSDGTATIDITSPAFARRFANLLTDRRASAKRSLRAMARRSDKHFSRRALRRYEAGEAPLDMVTVSALASLYEVDIDAIVPLRTEIGIDGDGVIAAGGVTARFAPGDPDSLLETYLRLVRRLRDQEHAEEVSLRREDVERLAAHLGTSGESVVERLGTLMGATKAQRRVMAGLFLTGAMVITVAVPSVAALSGGVDGPGVASEGGSNAGEAAALVYEVDPTGSDAGRTPGERSTAGSTDSALDGRSTPDGPGAISIDLLEVDPPAEADPTADAEAATPPPADETADDPIDAESPAESPADPGAPAEPVAAPIPVADPPPPPAPEPPPPEPAPAPTTPPEPADVATGPPPVPEPPSAVVDPAPAPAPPPPAPEPPPPEPESPPAGDETVAVGPPPVPAPSPPIVDPPTDD